MAGFGDLSSLRGDVDPLLQGMLVELKNSDESFIAEKVCPTVKVASEEGTFLKANADAFLGHASTDFTTAAGAPAIQTGLTLTTGTYLCVEKRGVFPVSIRDVAEGGVAGVDMAELGMRGLLSQMRIEKEIAAAALFQSTANWTSTAAASNAWSDTSSGTPLANVDAAVKQHYLNSGRGPDTMILEFLNWQEFRKHPDITSLAQIRGSAPSQLTQKDVEGLLQELFGIKKLYIGSAVKNGAQPGQAVSNSFVFAHATAWIGYTGVGENVGMTTPVAAKCFATRDWSAKKYFDDSRDSHMCQVSTVYQLKNVVPQYGYTITSI